MSAEWILEFDNVSLEGHWPYDQGLAGLSCKLAPGDLMLIELGAGGSHTPLCDLAGGVTVPELGRVLFRGDDWAALDPDQAAAARARIGRVFAQPRWISNLDVDENITLSARHHTPRPEREIEADAADLARAMGLPDLPRARPALVRAPELRLADWVRALAGERDLILLEYPLQGVYRERWPVLLDQLGRARSKGAAVLWLQDEWPAEWQGGVAPTRVAELKEGRCLLVERNRHGQAV